MAEKSFKRQCKPDERERQHRAAPQSAPAPAHQATAERVTGHALGMPYQSGTAFHLAAENDDVYGPTDALTEQLENPPTGQPLDSALRRPLERRFGRRFGQVQIHQGPSADQLTGALGTRAFAFRQHIWLGAGADRGDVRLMAHELTHVAQQGYAPPLPSRTTEFTPTPGTCGTDGAHGAARPHGATAAPVQNPAPAGAASTSGGVVQGIDLWESAVDLGGAVVDRASEAAEFVGDIPENLAEMSIEGVRGVLRRVAPDFLRFFDGDGLRGFLRDIVDDGIDSLFSGVFEAIQKVANVDSFAAGFDEATEWFSSIGGELGRGFCRTVLRVAGNIKTFFSDTFGPIINDISDIACKVKGYLTGIWESIGAPIWDFLQQVGGDVWQSVKGLMSDVGDLIGTAKDALGSAWDTVKDLFGIEAEEGESEGGGIWDWLKDIAGDIGESISEFVEPIMGPLRDAAGVLLLFVPGGQIVAVMLLWPRLRQAFDWLTDVWEDLNLIPRAREYLTGTVFPFLMNIAESMAQTFLSFADWMVAGLSDLVRTVQDVVNEVPDILLPLRPVVSFVLRLFQKVLGFARKGIRFVSRHFRSIMRKLLEILEWIGRALLRLITIVANPLGLVGFLVGMLWKMLPDCIKGPLINFILDILIGFIRRIPGNPMLGILWPLVKNGLLGFLETVRALALQRKVDISNKIANIMAGGSPSFVLGYFLGLIEGLWNAITAPFQALAALFELPEQIRQFLRNLGVRLCEIIEQIRCFAASLAGQVFGSVDRVLSAIREFLSDPARIVSIIRCAIEGVLAGAREMGSQMARQMISVFEGPDENIGRRLGGITGEILFQVVVGFFTAGSGTAVSTGLGIVNRIASALRTVGRAIDQVLQRLRGLFGRLLDFVKGLAARFGQAIARGGKSVLGKLGGLFRRFARWLADIGKRLFRRVGGRVLPTGRERVRWALFKQTLRGRLRSYSSGIRKSTLKRLFRRVRRQYRDVAKWPSYITKHGPHWRLWSRRVKSIAPREVATVLLDRDARWDAGAEAIRKTVNRYRRRPGYMGTRDILRLLRPIKREYGFKGRPSVTFDEDDNEFVIRWSMSSTRLVANVGGEVPSKMNWFRPIVSGQKVMLDNFAYHKSSRSAPTGSTARLRELSKIRSAPTFSTSAYVRGHLISGWFTHGRPSNWTPITRSANWWMGFEWETPLRRAMKSRAYIDRKIRRGSTLRLKFYRMTVEAKDNEKKDEDDNNDPPMRDYLDGRPGEKIEEESSLATEIKMDIVRKTYDPDTETFRENPSRRLSLPGVPKSKSVPNVPNRRRYGPHGYPYGKLS